MKNRSSIFIALLFSLFCCITVANGFNEGPFSLDTAYKEFSNSDGAQCFVVGSFKVIHTKWDIQDPELDNTESINNSSMCSLTASLERLDNNKNYKLKFKPVSGSDSILYPKKTLAKNDDDPFWVIPIQPGEYELTTVTFRLTMNKNGYRPFDTEIFTVPLMRDLKRKIRFTAKPNQLIYIGDYAADFKTNIRLSQMTSIYTANQCKFSLADNFEAFNATLTARAKERAKTKLSTIEIVDALQ